MQPRLYVTPLNSDQSRAFWVESSVPLNIEDRSTPGLSSRAETDDLAQDGLAALVEAVRQCQQVVIAVHGFNIPKWVAERLFARLSESVRSADPTAVFIGYRWPSETLFSNIRSWLYAAPPTIVGVATLFALLLAAGWGFGGFWTDLALMFGAGLVAGVLASLWLLRGLVYFRDLDRATNHGIPDLVHLIRELDRRLGGPENPQAHQRVQLSFVAHSMGAMIVVGAIRLLADCMAPLGAAPGVVSRTFSLGRLVLVSPDIPVELIMPRRSNWMQESLLEFDELHLFSSDGDIVLKMISTIANYVRTPLRFWANGYRLGNMAVKRPTAGSPFGIVNDALAVAIDDDARFLESLRLGWFTLYQRLHAIPKRGAWFDWFAERATLEPLTARDPAPATTATIALRFTYFDCTDSVDGPHRLTRSKQKVELSLWDNWQLLWDSARNNPAVDVQSGYFYGPFTVHLMGRLATIGLREGVSLRQLSSDCQRVHIRVLVPKEHARV
jgi:hypothetical protein